MGSGDIATNIRSIYRYKKKEIKYRKLRNVLSILFAISAVLAICFGYYSRIVKVSYAERHAKLLATQEDLEIVAKEVTSKRELVDQEWEELKANAAVLEEKYSAIIKSNISYQNAQKIAASVGITPQNYDEAEIMTEAVDYDKLEYVGEFEITAYTPSVEECSNNLGYTASGKPIIAGVSVAVDNKFWKLGTKFYIEGLGYVVAMDTGNAVKGKYRIDYAVFDKEYALQLGRRDWKVYLVLEE